MRSSRIPDLWRFVLITVAAVAAAALTAGLGFWQLDRAAQKQALTDSIARQQALAPWHGAQLAAHVPAASQPIAAQQMQELLHRPVQLQGRWLAQETIYLDNRQMQGRPGFFVLTPLQLSAPDDAVVVVVQRGWVPRNFMDRTLLPPVPTPAGLVMIEGRLEAPPSKLMELENTRLSAGAQNGADPDGQKSRIRQNADIPAWAQQSGLPLLGLSILQTGEASEGAAGQGTAGDGLLRDWPVINAGVQKHYGYAFQWFGLCLLIVLLYVWFQLVRRFFLRRPAGDACSGAASCKPG
ncbi:SURF1 family protein [Comamonas sp.]|uniref:SURF1 family protein n=1 Tax=Comamonas sp. TaxID=34028 RepID=UPI003A9535C2